MSENNSSNSPNYSYGFYTEEQLEQYYEEIIGDPTSTITSLNISICNIAIITFTQEASALAFVTKPSVTARTAPPTPTTWTPSSSWPTSCGTVRPSPTPSC